MAEGSFGDVANKPYVPGATVIAKKYNNDPMKIIADGLKFKSSYMYQLFLEWAEQEGLENDPRIKNAEREAQVEAYKSGRKGTEKELYFYKAIFPILAKLFSNTEQHGVEEEKGILWRIIQSEATGRYHVVKGYNKNIKMFKNKYGAGDFISKEDAQAKADELNKGVSEDLDADQQRVGQLGPTSRVKNNNIGKLVGANESVNLSEMDKSQPSSDRGGESSGNPYAKGGKATPVKAKDIDKDAETELNKTMDKAHKKDVKEGQEDLEAMLRIINR